MGKYDLYAYESYVVREQRRVFAVDTDDIVPATKEARQGLHVTHWVGLIMPNMVGM